MKEQATLEPQALAFASQQLNHVMQEMPAYQLSLIKNYLWLAVVFITAQSTIYENKIQTLQLDNISNIAFCLSVICSLFVLIIGILLLSGMWFKRPIMPFNRMQDITAFLKECYNANCDVNYQNTGIMKNIDLSLNSYDHLLKIRAVFLKIQCLSSLGAVFFGIISFLML